MKISVNRTVHDVDVDPDTPLLWVLRDVLGMTGTKYGCGIAACGACTVLVDGQPQRSCSLQAQDIGASDITTIEAIEADPVGRRVIAAWIALDVPQCGYCQSGQVVAATALLQQDANPSDTDIDGAMSGNLCRCGTYPRIRQAIHLAAATTKA